MKPSRIRSDKRLGRRHERFGEGLGCCRHVHRVAEVIELMANTAAEEKPF